MKFQLNINMEILGSNHCELWFQGRYDTIRNLIGNFDAWLALDCGRDVRQVEHPTEDMLILQNVFVAEIECEKFTHQMRQFIASLADVLCQGCIAVMHPSTQHGSLIGSETSPWGEFDMNKFITIDEVKA